MSQQKLSKMMNGTKRDNRIQKLVSLVTEKGGAMTVKDIADYLEVTKMTIYRDVQWLQEQQIVSLLNGVVIYNDEKYGRTGTLNNEDYDLPSEMQKNAPEKKLIAERARELIYPGETIFIDSGSTMEYFSRVIPENKNLVICCHSLYVLINSQMKSGCDLVFSGGYYHKDSMIFESDESVRLFQKIRINKAFFSAGGVHPDLGVTIANPFSINIKNTVLSSSQKKILLVDSSKFGTLKSVYFTDITQFDTIVTDWHVSDKISQFITNCGIELVIAEAVK